MSRLVKAWVGALLMPPFAGVLRLPRYFREWRAYALQDPAQRPRWRDAYPCLHDATARTPFDPHYFYQAAWLGRELASAEPAWHVDVGSSVAMLSVLSAFVETVFVDYRPLQVNLPGLACVAGNVAALPLVDRSVSSLSCLHVVEHIGLGRYGDPLDCHGGRKAAAELARVLKPQGRLYLSVPVGRKRVCFNAHRVFDPVEVSRDLFPSLSLERFSCVRDDGSYEPEARPEALRLAEYACGLFVFERRE